MQQYSHIEDYLELLAGYEPGNVNRYITPNASPFSLARYDVNIVSSMASHTTWGGALTDRQAKLATDLVLKYRRQFAKMGVDVTPAESPQFRLPVRSVDRSKRIWIEGDKIALKFPYDNELIATVREYAKIGQGSAKFNSSEKVWYLGITEHNVNWVVTLGAFKDFEVDEQIQRMFELVIECEKTPYEIKLVKTESGFEITNAAPSLIDYINEHVGGFGPDNMYKLVDHAGVLGYTVDVEIMQSLQYAATIFGNEHSIHMQPSEYNWDVIAKYAKLTNRYPICVFDPHIGRNKLDLSRFADDEVVFYDYSGNTKNCNFNFDNVKVVYAQKIPSDWNHPVPLLVATVEMMYGGKRMEWVNNAQKIVQYFDTKLIDGNSKTNN